MPTTHVPRVTSYDGFICDLDGVVFRGGSAVPAAVQTLNDLEAPLVFATNNASRTPVQVTEHLRGFEMAVANEQVVTSAQAGAAEIAQRLPGGVDVLAVGGPGVANALCDAGLRVATETTPQVAAVLQGFGPDVRAKDLAEASYAVGQGALWVGTNADMTLPTDRGLAPGNGALLATVAAACGRDPDLIVGKPHPPLYRMCLARLGLPISRVLAVGDRLDTDIEGAVTAGLDSLLVLTGVHDVVDAALAPARQRPTFVAEDLSAVGRPLNHAGYAEDWWTCGKDVRRLRQGAWQVKSTGSRTDRLTNILHAVAEAVSADDSVSRQDVAALRQDVAALVAAGLSDR
ncbi:MAG: HAD-IIA family hydrolase [Nostocoides sp.]